MTTDAAGERVARPRPTLYDLLFRPFGYVAGAQSLALGLAAIVAAGSLGRLSSMHFDGVLDIHTGRPAPLSVFLYEGIVDWLALSIALFVLGRFVSRAGFRALDLFGTQALARWPTILASFVALAPPCRRLAASIAAQALQPGALPADRTDVILGGLLFFAALLAIVWMVALMYHSYSLCCNLRGPRAALSFLVAVVVSEIVAKLVLIRILVS